MFAVIFVVHPKDERRKKDYLGFAKHLKPMLERIDGFVDNERFESKRTEGDILSLSTWRDEKAVVRWRTLSEHHSVQERGRFEVFEDYHLRVGEITADSHPPAGLSVDQKRFDETAISEAKVCTITEVMPADNASLTAQAAALPAHLGLDTGIAGLVDHVVFEGITIPGKLLLLLDWKDASRACAWTPQPFAGASSVRHRHVRVVRVYGMRDRREAPQYYSDVPPISAQ
jgi:heme-degrading monooxygenase HmoA